MNEVYSIDFNKERGYPLKQDTLRVMQQTYSGMLGALAEWHRDCVPGVVSEAVIVSGLSLSPAAGGLNSTAGWVAIGELMVYVPAAFLAGGTEFSPLFVVLNGGPDPDLDPAYYAGAGVSHNVHYWLRGQLSLSGTGLFAPLSVKRFYLRLAEKFKERTSLGDSGWSDPGTNTPGFNHGPRPFLVARTVEYLGNIPVTRVTFRGCVKYEGAGLSPATTYTLSTLPAQFRPDHDVVLPVGVRDGVDGYSMGVRITAGGAVLLRPTVALGGDSTFHFEGAGWMT